MSEHVHAHNMLLYAEDAFETDKPWEYWEHYMRGQDVWLPLDKHPNWHDFKKYRRKPK